MSAINIGKALKLVINLYVEEANSLNTLEPWITSLFTASQTVFLFVYFLAILLYKVTKNFLP